MKLPLEKKRSDKKKKRAYELLEKNDRRSTVPYSIIVKEREVTTEVMVNCKYCGALIKVTSMRCPNCGAYKK